MPVLMSSRPSVSGRSLPPPPPPPPPPVLLPPPPPPPPFLQQDSEGSMAQLTSSHLGSLEGLGVLGSGAAAGSFSWLADAGFSVCSRGLVSWCFSSDLGGVLDATSVGLAASGGGAPAGGSGGVPGAV